MNDEPPTATVAVAVPQAETGPLPAEVRAVFEAEYPDLLRLAVLTARCEATAAEAVHETFIRLCRSWTTIRDAQRTDAWLRSTMLNLLRNRWKRDRSQREKARRLRPVEEPGADVAALLAEDQRAVIDAVRTLPDRQRAVLVLRYWRHCSEAEIAAELGISTGSVKTHASRALATLRDRLEVSR